LNEGELEETPKRKYFGTKSIPEKTKAENLGGQRGRRAGRISDEFNVPLEDVRSALNKIKTDNNGVCEECASRLKKKYWKLVPKPSLLICINSKLN
jgi:RNA polymerase-binding transcription factor DksA